MNPITHKSHNTTAQNGANQQVKPAPKSNTGQDAGSVEKLAHDRLLYLFANFMVRGISCRKDNSFNLFDMQGQTASVTVRSGDVFSGIFFGASIDNQDIAYLMKMVQQTKSMEKNEAVNGVKDNQQDYIGIGDDHSMSFEGKDVVDLAVEGVSLVVPEKQANGTITCFHCERTF